MPVKVKLARKNDSLLWRAGRLLALVCLAGLVLFAIVFGIAYHHYQNVVDERLAHGPLFASVAQIYAAPQEVRPGQHLTAASIGQSLRRAGYNGNPQLGSFQLRGNTVLIKPGPQSFHSADGATITTTDGVVQSITAENGVALRSYQLEPQLITALSEDKNRTKRRLVIYKDIPPHMVQAVVAIEDHSFFTHSGVNYPRLIKCAVIDTFSSGRPCGGSTLTMQLARGFFLTPARTKKRKLEEIMITYQLESRFNKQQIFEMYANQINLGQRGSYAVNGFGEAAQAFFGKDLRQLDTAESAMLAGIINSPNKLNPYRHPERAMARRNLVLDQMVETGSLTASEAERAKAEPLHLAPPNVDASEAPYFVDLVHDQIVQRVGDQELSHDSLRIYTSLDPDLQRAASEAVEAGMKNVDDLVRRAHKKGATNLTYPQVALVALNPHTGQVLALVGGRNYGVSQLDHATSKRPTGSIFKPFVYATAEQGTVNGQTLSSGPFTATTILHDVPTTFTFDNGRQTYAPGNYKDEFHGDVTAIYALAHSLNNATISLGQQVGFENVAALARASGITGARGTPSVSLGAYDATPLDMAGAYTVFANGGVHLNPWLLASVRNANGDIVADFAADAKQVMDPRAAFLTQSLLEGVMNFGYGVEVRKRGFTAPAAGKTGTSHDAWFAAYSSNLICIVWVGNDDYTDVKLSGALAAAPIWAEFMNRAIKLPQYSDMTGFTPPENVHVLRIDRATNLPADETCPSDAFTAAFLDGTAPAGTCSHMGEDTQSLGARIFGTNTPPDANAPLGPDGQPAEPPKHRNVFQKMFGLGKEKKPEPPPQ
jgi:penicillin-binding protein 1B